MNAVELIKEFEGFRNNAYNDGVDNWTIGYGFTYVMGKKVKEGDYITKATAENELKRIICDLKKQILPLLKKRLNDQQLAVIISFTYNLGIGNFKKSTLRKVLNSTPNDCNSVRKQLLRWVNAGGKRMQGLVNRRKKEADIYCKSIKNCQ